MKKILRFLLLILISLFSFQLVYAEDGTTEFAGARFSVNEILADNELPYGVKHTKLDGFTSTSLQGYDADGLGGKSDLVVPGEYYSQKVNILEVPSSDTVRVTTWANLNNHRWTLTTVKGMIADYESKNPGWKVIGAINGDFFDIGGNGNLPYQTSGAMVSGGEYYKTTTGRQVGLTNDGREDSLIGNETIQRTEYIRLAVYNEDGAIISEFDIEKLNTDPGTGETALYFATYNAEHNIVPVSFNVNEGASCFVVREAELALPNNANDFYGRGVISSVVPQELSQGQFALVTDNEAVKAALAVGVRIRCQFEYIGDYNDATDITGCGDTIMDNGEANLKANLANRAPRTVIGRKADGTIVMMVIDGRQAGKGMYGADHTELAVIMKSYGCVEAYNLDGGGSSTLIIRQGGQFIIQNSPSDGNENGRTDSNCLLIVVKDPKLEVEVSDMQIDALTFNINIINENHHDITHLYIKIGSELKEVQAGTVSFTGLNPNTEYPYRIYYRNSEGEMIWIATDGKQKTLKRMPEFLGLVINEDGEYFKITVLYNDPDKASTLDIAYLGINGKLASFYKGEMRVMKSKIGNRISGLFVEYYYNLNDGKNIFVQINTPDIEYHRNFEAQIQYIPNYINEYLKEIYQ